MIQGTYYKEWSSVLNREMEFKVYAVPVFRCWLCPPAAAAFTIGRTTVCRTPSPSC